MAKSIAQRLTALEKLVAGFFTGQPKRKSKRTTKRTTKAKKSKAKKSTRKTGARRKAGGRRRSATAMPMPPG